jgi:hypothetical protein
MRYEKVQKIKKRIERYESAYYSELRSLLTKYKSMSEAFPDFLKGSKLISATLGTDGVVVIQWPAAQDRFEFRFDERALREIVAEIPGSLSDQFPSIQFELNYPLNPNFDVTFASPMIQHRKVDEKGNETLVETRKLSWEKMRVSANLRPTLWNEDVARRDATIDIQAFITAHLMNLEREQPPTIIDEFEKIINGFSELLDSQPLEGIIQRYLEQHGVLLSQNAVSIVSQMPLGSEYAIDFVIELPNQEYVLVEIERPNLTLFNKKGDPSGELTHAYQQVENWRNWINEFTDYAKQRMPGIINPECWVIIGRRSSLQERDKNTLRRKNRDNPHIKIMTYDELLEKAGRALKNMKRSWNIHGQSNALPNRLV